MRRVGMILFLAGMLLVASAGWAQTELLTNAGFEDGPGMLGDWEVKFNGTATSVNIVRGRTTDSPTAPDATSDCAPGVANEGTWFVSFSTDDGATGQTAGSGSQVWVEQTADVTAFIPSIDCDAPGPPDPPDCTQATVSFSGMSTSLECFQSPDRAHVELEFFDTIGGVGSSLGVVRNRNVPGDCATTNTPPLDPSEDSCRPPDGSGSTGSGATTWAANDPRESNWRLESLSNIMVPVGTRSIVFRLVSTLGPNPPGGTSIGVGGDAFSAPFTPVELQSFSIE